MFLASEQKVFVEFGARVSDGSGGYKYLHEFTYKLVPSANVIAAIDGIITAIRYQAETNDYEFDVRPASNSEWTVNYDHVQDLTISEGSQVRAGDILGKPQNWGDPFISRVELALLRDVGPFRLPSYRYCPFAAFDPGLVNEYKQKVTKLMDDWETFKGDNSIYDESQFTYAPGCTSENVVQSYGSYLPMVTKEYQP